ncbi:MAG: hypothetical protein BWZ09_02302 [Alphaproteobacteria bacterium ADurb.BinA305]|nr:MAG: hypothetical protein BWZ09_02302 [Alphaproteobacteria bacterium ADurb.BinA305]
MIAACAAPTGTRGLRIRRNRGQTPISCTGASKRLSVVAQRGTGVRARVRAHRLRRAFDHDRAAAFAALGAEVDDPVGSSDHVEVVLDHDQRMARLQQLVEGAEQLGDVLEVQAGGGLVEEEEQAGFGLVPSLVPKLIHNTGFAYRLLLRGLGEVAGELEALRLATRQRRHGLAEAQVIQADVGERRERGEHLGMLAEHIQRLMHGELQHVGHRQPVPLQFKHFRPITLAVAVRAAQPHVGQELHLDVLEARAGAGRAAAVAGVEAEGAGGIAALLRLRQGGEEGTDRVPGADVAHRVGARALADRRLVHHDHAAQVIHILETIEDPRRFRRFPEMLGQRREQHVLDQRRFSRAGHAGQAGQAPQRETDREIAQVVLARADQLQPRCGGVHRARRTVDVDALRARQPGAGHRIGIRRDLGRRAARDDVAAALARAGADLEQLVGGDHHLRVVLDHHQRVAGVAQPRHHPEDAADVARMQADRGLVEHEQGIHQRGAERGGQVDALHLAARQRARLAVQRQVAEADVGQVGESAADLAEHQLGGLVRHAGQRERGDGVADAVDRQRHQLVDGEALHPRERNPRRRGCLADSGRSPDGPR